MFLRSIKEAFKLIFDLYLEGPFFYSFFYSKKSLLDQKKQQSRPLIHLGLACLLGLEYEPGSCSRGI